jgi:signal transduction histidine kinase
MNTLGFEFPIFLLAVISNIVLAAVVFLYSPKQNISRRFFLLFVSIQILWATGNYVSFFVPSQNYLFWVRMTLFSATLHAFSFFLFIYSFTEQKNILKEKFFLPAIGAFLAVAALTFSSYVFTHLEVNGVGQLLPKPGPAIGLFGVFVASCALSGFYVLLRKLQHAKGNERKQMKYVFTGLCTTFILILGLAFVSFIFFENLSLVRFSHVYTLPFVAFTAYAMLRFNFFNIKTLVAEIGVLLLVFVLLFPLFGSQTMAEALQNLLVLVSTIILGIFVIRGVLQEVEQRKKIEQIAKDLASANEHLRELDKEKSEFVSIASHQLRTPLTAISGYASMLLEGSYGKLSKKAEESVNRIYQSSGRLALIIEDFLDITKIEQGKMSYQFTTVDMKELLQEVTGEMKPHAYEKNLELTLKIEDQGSFNATADLGKIRQVISNLIDNAIKYSPTGKITVTLSRDSVRGKICVSIHDKGIGISPQSMEKLFQKFSRAEGVKKIYTEGSGLGLYVAQEMIKAHHGRIWAESEGEGKGSTFHVELMGED